MFGFKIHTVDGGRVPAFEYLAADGLMPKIGMALVAYGGVLSQAVGAVKPTYISMCEKNTACEDGDIIPVIRVQEDIVFGAGSEDDMAAVKLGDKLTISEDAMGVTNVTDGGTAEVIAKDENGVFVRFA